jgi:hypothetical protein
MFPLLQGKAAIENIQYFIKKLEQGNKDLTKKQINSLKKVAKALIDSIEPEVSGALQIKVGVAN